MRGLDLLTGIDIWPHYQNGHHVTVSTLANRIRRKILAFPEDGAAVITAGNWQPLGRPPALYLPDHPAPIPLTPARSLPWSH